MRRLISGPVPALFFIAGVIVLHFYPITNEYYRVIQEKITARRAAEEASSRDGGASV